ncbi:MAG: signal peptidase I [Desulfobacteraceae bacterium]|nr:MAG: signal peptidase I [Desulfobacteraceae bacterium]
MMGKQFISESHSLKIVPFTGYSMYPALKPGDFLFLQKISIDTARPGDIIALLKEDHYITHRVIRIQRKEGKILFQAKGDNLENMDEVFALSGPFFYKVVLVQGKRKNLCRPMTGKKMALLSKNNLMYGILKRRLGRIIRFLFFHFFSNKKGGTIANRLGIKKKRNEGC